MSMQKPALFTDAHDVKYFDVSTGKYVANTTSTASLVTTMSILYKQNLK